MRKSRLSEYILKYIPEGMHGWLASLYEREIARPLLQEFYEDVAKDVTRKISSGRILDLATGPGYLPINIAEKSPNIHVTGLDISKKMVKYARRNAVKASVLDHVSIIYGDGNHLPFRNESYDIVISTGVLFTSPHPIRILNECYRVLKNEQGSLDY